MKTQSQFVQGLLGRYPIHFHFSGDVSGSLVAKNTIRQSNNGCIVVHGTNNLQVEENVAFDNRGHCYVTEDGIEVGNTFFRNLEAQISIPEKNIPEESDKNPAVFWISNPSNKWIENTAAGSEGVGYWFELRKRGTHPNRYPDLDPKRDVLTLFKDNAVHSCLGVRISNHFFR